MNDESWRRVEELFHAALERAPETRHAFLDEVCRDDVNLRRQVELLLAKDAQAESFLESAPLSDSMPTAVGLIGRQFGPHRVVSLLPAVWGTSIERMTASWAVMLPSRLCPLNSRAIRNAWRASGARRAPSLP